MSVTGDDQFAAYGGKIRPRDHGTRSEGASRRSHAWALVDLAARAAGHPGEARRRAIAKIAAPAAANAEKAVTR
jgi:hypothetical protein